MKALVARQIVAEIGHQVTARNFAARVDESSMIGQSLWANGVKHLYYLCQESVIWALKNRG